jgi:hypothetical protein
VGIHREENLITDRTLRKDFFCKLLREGERRRLGLHSGQNMEKSGTDRKGKISVA